MDELKLFNKLKKLRELSKIQYDSTTPMDEYHTGMYNGLECVLAILDEREPNYKEVEQNKATSLRLLAESYRAMLAEIVEHLDRFPKPDLHAWHDEARASLQGDEK